jgi:hypothetical protein
MPSSETWCSVDLVRTDVARCHLIPQTPTLLHLFRQLATCSTDPYKAQHPSSFSLALFPVQLMFPLSAFAIRVVKSAEMYDSYITGKIMLS